MNRKQLTQLLARVSGRSPACAADQIDALVYRMLKDLKRPFVRHTKESPNVASAAHFKQGRQ